MLASSVLSLVLHFTAAVSEHAQRHRQRAMSCCCHAAIPCMLCAAALQDEKDETVQSALLTKWGQLHSVRTVLSMSAFAVMLAAALRKRSA